MAFQSKPEDLTDKARTALKYLGKRATQKNVDIITKFWDQEKHQYTVTYNLKFLEDFIIAYPRLLSEYNFNKKFNKFIED